MTSDKLALLILTEGEEEGRDGSMREASRIVELAGVERTVTSSFSVVGDRFLAMMRVLESVVRRDKVVVEIVESSFELLRFRPVKEFICFRQEICI